jgi:hypothetical protein
MEGDEDRQIYSKDEDRWIYSIEEGFFLYGCQKFYDKAGYVDGARRFTITIEVTWYLLS